MPGSNDDSRRWPEKMRPRLVCGDRLLKRNRQPSDTGPVADVEAKLLEELKKIGEDILTETPPKRLTDVLHKKKR